MSSSEPRRLHPDLKRPVVFTCPLPSANITANIEFLEAFVETFSWSASVSSRKFPSAPETPFFLRIDFGLLDEAEECLARLQGIIIDNNDDPLTLSVSHTPPGTSWTRLGVGYTRSIFCAVKAREGVSESPDAEVYDVLRAFGPLYTFRKNEDGAAHTHHAQFIDDEDATKALKETNVMSDLFSLRRYNPCEVFCANIPMDTDEEDLEALFAASSSKGGSIVSAKLVKRKNSCFAFIVFEDETSAKYCVQYLHGFWMQNSTLPLYVSFSEMRSATMGNTGKPVRPEPTSSASPASKWGAETAPPDWGNSTSSASDWGNTTTSASDWGNATASTSDWGNANASQAWGDINASKKWGKWEPTSQATPTPQPSSQTNDDNVKIDPLLLQRMAQAWKTKADRLESELVLSNMRAETEAKKLKTECQAHAKIVKVLNETIEDITRRLSISDSRRKLMELELEDRTAWLANQKKKEAALKEEQEQFEAAKRKAELDEARERMKRMQEDNARIYREKEQRREEQQRQRKVAEKDLADAEQKRQEALAKLAELRRECDSDTETESDSKTAAEKDTAAEQRRKESLRKLEELRRERDSKEAAEKAAVAKAAAEKAAAEKAAAEKAAAEVERKRREALAKLEELRREKAWSDATIRETQRCINRDKTDWGLGPWTVVKSLRRFSKLVADMETGRFSESVPFTAHVVPWPILGDPRGVVVKDIQWASVDDFFNTISRNLTLTAYKQLLHKVHLMFHPDRWKSKGYLATVQNMEERQVLERAGNVVSQAVAPLWQKSREG